MNDKSNRMALWKNAAAIIITVVGVISGIAGAATWIHHSAQQAVLDEKFLATLTARVRPTCIFDSHGSIEADLGAGDYIEDIKVTPEPKIYGYEITIKTKRYLAYPPLITGLDADLFPQATTRGKMYDWNIELSPNSTTQTIMAESPMNTNTVHRFKLEILH
jgi:hypothetical protein